MLDVTGTGREGRQGSSVIAERQTLIHRLCIQTIYVVCLTIAICQVETSAHNVNPHLPAVPKHQHPLGLAPSAVSFTVADQHISPQKKEKPPRFANIA